jgi:hypothetical protein
MGDTIILVEIDSNDSKISMQIPKECPPMPANDSVEIQRRPELTFRCQPMPFNDSAECQRRPRLNLHLEQVPLSVFNVNRMPDLRGVQSGLADTRAQAVILAGTDSNGRKTSV